MPISRRDGEAKELPLGGLLLRIPAEQLGVVFERKLDAWPGRCVDLGGDVADVAPLHIRADIDVAGDGVVR